MKVITIEYIKKLGKEKNDENLDLLLDMFYNLKDLKKEIKREIISSIGRQKNLEKIYSFIKMEVFKQEIMDFVYQMYRTLLYKSKIDKKFKELEIRVRKFYDNEIINKMYEFYNYKKSKIKEKTFFKLDSKLLKGDSSKTLKQLPENSINLIFTSPPYYNAKEYSNYQSYNNYLLQMKNVIKECQRVLEKGRFLIINVSPVITKRVGREFESIRYPLHFDFHKILVEENFEFVDEIIWIKPEASVPNRFGGFYQTRKPLAYKPNCITESIMVYRSKAPFLLDKNMKKYSYNIPEDVEVESTNCWFIKPKKDKQHPAVFPEELCERILTYYSYENDVVLDPFAGSGTFGKVAKKMNRIPILCEKNEKYIKRIEEEKICQ